MLLSLGLISFPAILVFMSNSLNVGYNVYYYVLVLQAYKYISQIYHHCAQTLSAKTGVIDLIKCRIYNLSLLC